MFMAGYIYLYYILSYTSYVDSGASDGKLVATMKNLEVPLFRRILFLFPRWVICLCLLAYVGGNLVDYIRVCPPVAIMKFVVA